MPPTGELLEREEELATIERTLSAAAAGNGGLLIIDGEAGAGKTALLDVVGRLAAQREMLVLSARGGEYERDFPYGVVRQLFEPLLVENAGRSELLSGNAAPAAPIFDPLAAPPAGSDPYEAQHGVYWLVTGLADSSPVVLFVDDAQWGDLASLRALVYIGRRLSELPVLLALTVRTGEPGEHDRLLDELRREPGAWTITPPPLTAGAVAALVADESGHTPSDGFATACREATAGNPFLLGELLRALASEGTEPIDENADRLAEIAACGVARSILARLARLGEHSVEVARAVAVLEPNAEMRLIAELADLPPSTVTDACERLVVASLLSDSRPVSFVHPLVREAVLSDIPEPRRAADHRRAARLLSRGATAGSDVVASHLMLAEPSGDSWVVRELRSAATAALGRGTPEAAVSYLRRALREPPAKGDRPSVSRELGAALLRANEPEGIEVLRAVRSTLDDEATRAEIATVISISLALRGRAEEGVSVLEESLAEIPDHRAGLGLLLRGHLIMQLISGLERIPEGFLATPDEALDAETLEGRMVLREMGFLYAIGLGSMEHAMEFADRGKLNIDALRADALAGLPANYVLGVLTLADCGDRVVGMAEEVIEASRQRGSMPGVASGYGLRSYCLLADGKPGPAQADAEAAIRIVQPYLLHVHLAQWIACGLLSKTASGDFSGAQELLDHVWGAREPVRGLPGAVMLVARGELRLATGRHAEAKLDFLSAAERVKWLPYANPEILGWRTGLAQAEAALGNRQEAQRLAGEAVRLAREVGGRRGVGIALRVEGTVTEGGEGLARLRESAAILGDTRARLQHARSLAELGAALRRANRRKEAREPLREALDLTHRCGAKPLEEFARTELEATGARPRTAVLSGVDSLTPSELRVARLAADGMTNREIALELTVTPKTVETHLRHTYQKLDVEGRAEIAGVLADE